MVEIVSAHEESLTAEPQLDFIAFATFRQTKEFDAQIQFLDIPNLIHGGYSPPTGFVRCGRSACRIAKLKWEMGNDTGGDNMEDPFNSRSTRWPRA